jgi:peptide/nickel transport system substrate-binding protein
VGTGPFRFGEWVRGDRLVFERNEHYFIQGRPRIDRVVWRILPSPTAAAIALERGEVDYISTMDGAQLARLRSAPNVTVGRHPAGAGGGWCVNTLIPNLRRPALADARVRQALSQAIDRAFLAERVYQGTGRAARGPLHSELNAADRRPPPLPFDPSATARLLDAAGLPQRGNQPRLRLQFTYSTRETTTLAEALRDQFARVGVELQLEPMDFNAAVEKVFIRQDFDLGYASYCNGADPDIGVKRVYDSRNILPIPFGNGAGYNNPAIDSLFDAAAGTLDAQRRRALYGEVQRVLLRDMPYLWLVESDGWRAWRSNVRGLRPWSGHTFDQATIVPPR